MKIRLHPENRSRMRQLIGGFVQHCEVSSNLSGTINLFVESQGRKFGLPVFTFYGPPHRDIETSFIGLLARNEGSDKRVSEALLQLLERLALQPKLAAGLVVSVLPVSDPISLESGDSAHPIHLREDLEERVKAFAARALDGLIEIYISPREQATVDVEGPCSIRNATIRAAKMIERLTQNPPQARLSLRGSSDDEHWNIRIAVPDTWSEGRIAHWVSQFLVNLLRARTEELLRRGEFEYLDTEYLVPFARNRISRLSVIEENSLD